MLLIICLSSYMCVYINQGYVRDYSDRLGESICTSIDLSQKIVIAKGIESVHGWLMEFPDLTFMQSCAKELWKTHNCLPKKHKCLV